MTAIRQAGPEAAPRPRRLAAIGLMAVGAALAGWAVPRFVAAIIGLPSDVVAFDIRHGNPVSRQALETMIAADTVAQSWHRALPRARQLAVGSLRLAAEAPDGSAERAVWLEAAWAASAEALARSPADPFMWIVRAASARLLGAEPELARAALAAAFRTGRFEPDLYRRRLALAMELWPGLDDTMRAQAGEAARLLAATDMSALVALGQDPGTRERVMLLLGNQAQVAAYLSALTAVGDAPGDGSG